MALGLWLAAARHSAVPGGTLFSYRPDPALLCPATFICAFSARFPCVPSCLSWLNAKKNLCAAPLGLAMSFHRYPTSSDVGSNNYAPLHPSMGKTGPSWGPRHLALGKKAVSKWQIAISRWHLAFGWLLHVIQPSLAGLYFLITSTRHYCAGLLSGVLSALVLLVFLRVLRG